LFPLAHASHQNSRRSFQIEGQLLETAHNAVAKVNAKLESKRRTMKAKHVSLMIAALLVTGGLWFARSGSRTSASQKSSLAAGAETPDGQPKPDQMLRPPDPNRKFGELTPEQRVQRARHPGDIGG
jgi:hypothetical protein